MNPEQKDASRTLERLGLSRSSRKSFYRIAQEMVDQGRVPHHWAGLRIVARSYGRKWKSLRRLFILAGR